MTIGDITKTVEELKDKGYPITEECELIADLDLKTKKETIKISFTDGVYKITVTKEIENDNKV